MDKYVRDLDTFREMFAVMKNSKGTEKPIIEEFQEKMTTSKGKEIFQSFRKEYGGLFGNKEKAIANAVDKFYLNARMLTDLLDVRASFVKSEATSLSKGFIHPELLEKKELLQRLDNLTSENQKLLQENKRLQGIEKEFKNVSLFYSNLSDNVVLRYKVSASEVKEMSLKGPDKALFADQNQIKTKDNEADKSTRQGMRL